MCALGTQVHSGLKALGIFSLADLILLSAVSWNEKVTPHFGLHTLQHVQALLPQMLLYDVQCGVVQQILSRSLLA